MLRFLVFALAIAAAPLAAQTAAATDNAEIAAMFAEDQAVRSDPARIDWAAEGRAGKQRMARTAQLVTEGKLQTGRDFYLAAFLYQHGDKPEHYLTAHTFANIALAKGYRAAWIGAASLDRYLQSMGKPQIYGTQYRCEPDGQNTQEPINRDVVPSVLLPALNVPLPPEQAKLGQEMQRRNPCLKAAAKP